MAITKQLETNVNIEMKGKIGVLSREIETVEKSKMKNFELKNIIFKIIYLLDKLNSLSKEGSNSELED